MENNIGVILDGLDNIQSQAVTNLDGPVLIVAGAGAGKTRVLTSRIAYAIGNGCLPERILALTFTKKAANEMKERIGMMVGERKARKLYMGTFHSVFIRFLREYAENLGYPKSFTIYDTSDSISAIKRCIKNLGLDDKTYKPKSVLSRISSAKNELWTNASYRRCNERMQDDIRSKMPRLCDIYDAYQDMMKKSGVMDFDDILMNMNILIKQCPEALQAIAERFDYILVDEYQDTNYSQYLILKKLSMNHKNLCVVGDDSQSIYAFRGARIENILNFSRDYPGYKLYKLERNYRSTQSIVNAANSVISKNSNRIPKECYSRSGYGEKIRLIKAYTDKEEALLVVSDIISRMRSDQAQYSDFAILYRTNNQSKALEEALRKRNLPYKIYAGNSFFDRAEVKDMMAYLKLAVNPNDNEAFRRIVNTPARGIGGTTIDCLAAAAEASSCSLYAAIDLPDLEKYGVKNAALSKLQAFKQMIYKTNSQLDKKNAYELAVALSDECGLYRSHKLENSIESQSRAANIEELMNSVKDFVERRANEFKEELLQESELEDVGDVSVEYVPGLGLDDFLEDISLLSAVDVDEEDDSEEDVDNKITLMTVHSSKGLEFDYVYVVGMEDGLFPSENPTSYSEIEEERRLFYVAMTRAKIALRLSFCTSRMRNGQTKEYPVSRFVKEIDRDYIENPALVENNNRSRVASISKPTSRTYYQTSSAPSVRPAQIRPIATAFSKRSVSVTAPKTEDKNFESAPVHSLKVGARIEHNRFGFGVIKEISGSVADMKATILFDNYGEKILILKYAKIRLA